MKVKTINFERQKGSPLYKQIYLKLQGDILSGYLRKGDQLPSIRKCESMMKVSKTSVERAYEQLLEEGYICSIPQKGYFVDVDAESASLRKAVLQQPIALEKKTIRYDFRSQTMDSASFDIALWKKYLKEVLDGHEEISTYGDAQGEQALRVALSKYAYSIRGVLCSSDQILIGSSFQSLLYVICGLFSKPCVIGMEESGFSHAETVFADYRFPVRKLSSNASGILMKELYESDVNVLYINSGSHGSNHQPLSRLKREELLQWAQDKNAYIIEDDHNGELRYRSKVTPAMQGFDMGKHVIYIGSFSKLLLPSLRISYLVFTKDLLPLFEQRRDSYSPTSSKIEQLALAHYIADGHLERHVRRLRKRYEVKSNLMRECIQDIFPDVECILEEASLQFILRFPASFSVETAIDKAKKHHILIQKNTGGDIVLSFAAIPQQELRKALEELHRLWYE